MLGLGRHGLIRGMVTETEKAIDAVWRIESPRLIAGLARIVRDVGVAEDLAQDALVAALEQWPATGVPRNPGAWLMAAAKNRAIDHWRRVKRLERKHEQIGRELADKQDAVPDLEAAIDEGTDGVGDDLLRLVFVACHPVLSTEAQVALTLRLLGGLTTDEIARAFLVSEPTVAQRIVRAKRTLAAKQVPFEVPRGEERVRRLTSVLGVLYLIFNEGYTATAGDDLMRPALCSEALRLGRILAELVPEEPEVHGLIALMEIQASRARARVGPAGEPIVLFEQNRAQWDQLLIRRGLAALDRADALGGDRGSVRASGRDRRVPRARTYSRRNGLEPHRRALRRAGAARAVAGRRVEPRSCRRDGARPRSRPCACRCADHGAVASGLPPPAKRARRSLGRLGRVDEARVEFERAAALTRNARERKLLLDRARRTQAAR